MDEERSKPATKGDLTDLRSELKSDITALKGVITDLEERLVETIRDSQTEVLKAFYGFSQTVLERFKEQDQTEAALMRRMATVESRIFDIEKRLNMPPSGI